MVPGLRHETCAPAPYAGMARGREAQLVRPNRLPWQGVEKAVAARDLVSIGRQLRRRKHTGKLGGAVSHDRSLPPGRDGSRRRTGLRISSRAGPAGDNVCAKHTKPENREKPAMIRTDNWHIQAIEELQTLLMPRDDAIAFALFGSALRSSDAFNSWSDLDCLLAVKDEAY